jgi:hypothetical protein
VSYVTTHGPAVSLSAVSTAVLTPRPGELLRRANGNNTIRLDGVKKTIRILPCCGINGVFIDHRSVVLDEENTPAPLCDCY